MRKTRPITGMPPRLLALAAPLLFALAACGGPGGGGSGGPAPGDLAIDALTAFCLTDGRVGVTVSWTASSGAAAYAVYRSDAGPVNLGTSTSYNELEGLSTGSSYEYFVRAINAGGSTDTESESIEIAADFCADGGAGAEAPGPVEIASLAAQCEPGPQAAVLVTWNAASNATGYELSRDHQSIAQLAGDVTEYLDDAVTPGGTYTYVVRARNAAGISIAAPQAITVPIADCAPPVGPTLSSFHNHTLALAADGTVWAWGSNEYGRLGQGNESMIMHPVKPLGLSGIVAVSAGRHISLALDIDGQVWAWGHEFGYAGIRTAAQTVPEMVAGLPAIVAVAAGDSHALAVDSDGRVWAWGDNWSGQLGLGNNWATYEPTLIPGLEDVVAVTAGEEFSLALHAGGTVSAWGNNGYGQLGVGDYDDRNTPQPVPGLDNVTAIAAGRTQHALALHADGTVSAWGCNDYGQLGNGASGGCEDSPVAVSNLSNVVAVSAGHNHSLALTDEGTVYAWGSNDRFQVAAASTGDDVLTPTLVPGLNDVVAIAAGTRHSQAQLASGQVRAWGNNSVFQLGQGTPDSVREPAELLLPTQPAMIASGGQHTIAVLPDGTVWTWGNNEYGQLGIAGIGSSSTPVQVPGLEHVVIVAAGSESSYAVDSEGNAWAWGANWDGQLGIGSYSSQTTPQPITTLTKVTTLAAGTSFTLAIAGDGELYAWGYNFNGQLGDGTTTTRNEPVPITMPAPYEDDVVIAIAAGHRHSLAVVDGGSVFAWGSNTDGQLGQGNTTGSTNSTPLAVTLPGGASAASVGAGIYSSFALTDDGSILSWGANFSGETGVDDSFPWITTPTPVEGVTATAMWNGYYHTTVRLESGGHVGWGQNWAGQLSPTAAEYFRTPVPVLGGAVATGEATFYLQEGGGTLASGYDESGQLGIGKLFMSRDPLLVPGITDLAAP